MLKVIRKQSNKIVLYSKDKSKVLGRFPFGPGNKYKNERTAREAAKKRERQIQYFKQNKTLRRSEMKSRKAQTMASAGAKVIATAKVHFRNSNNLYDLVALLQNLKKNKDDASTVRRINLYIKDLERAIEASKAASKLIMKVGKSLSETKR